MDCAAVVLEMAVTVVFAVAVVVEIYGEMERALELQGCWRWWSSSELGKRDTLPSYPVRKRPWCHLHDNAVAVEVGGGLGNLGGSGVGRHVDSLRGVSQEKCGRFELIVLVLEEKDV